MSPLDVSIRWYSFYLAFKVHIIKLSHILAIKGSAKLNCALRKIKKETNLEFVFIKQYIQCTGSSQWSSSTFAIPGVWARHVRILPPSSLLGLICMELMVVLPSRNVLECDSSRCILSFHQVMLGVGLAPLTSHSIVLDWPAINACSLLRILTFKGGKAMSTLMLDETVAD